MLGPTLVPDDVVVLDNLPAHNAVGLVALVEARGACLLYLPPYSPDFNPIEKRVKHLGRLQQAQHLAAYGAGAPARPWKPSSRPPPSG
ncbi:transposase [Hymenobacter terrenus]|uniref:transposase n=1 Tax=Hymenobacter terrenus TaxID=1629124 RepID=UPI00373FE2D6